MVDHRLEAKAGSLVKHKFVCGYGNCQKDAGGVITVTINGAGGQKQRFCCYTHASLWLRHRAFLYPSTEPLEEFK